MTTMTAKAKSSGDRSTHLAPVILFGIDGSGKPKAARFGTKHAGLATKAASQLQLRVLQGDDPRLAEIAGRLPVGKVHATGRMFVPFVRRDLYDKLLAAAPKGGSEGAATAPPPPAGSSSGATGSRPPSSPPNRPRTWQDIAMGDLVVAEQSADDGWFEAIIVAVTGDILTLRWRDYPKEKQIVRHRSRLGLLFPGPKPAAESKPGKAGTTGKQDKSAAGGNQNENGRALPQDWQAIDVNHLVLAKDDGPWLAWWEAIPIEKIGDAFKLRWKDRVNTVPFVRPRLELALICPDAA